MTVSWALRDPTMWVPYNVAEGYGGLAGQVVKGRGLLVGWSAEVVGSTPSYLLDGFDVTAPITAIMFNAGGGGDTHWFGYPGLLVHRGIYANMAGGAGNFLAALYWVDLPRGALIERTLPTTAASSTPAPSANV